MKKYTKYIVIIIFAVMMLASTITIAFAESVSFIKSQYTDEELETCEIQVLSDLVYVPVRFEMEFEPLPDEQSLTIITQSDLQFEKRPNSFIFLTETIDRHDITVKLDYKNDQKQREIFYRIYANSDPVVEGTWIHESSKFCKTFHFFAQEPPIVYDTAYFEEKFLEVEGKKLQEIITNQEESEAFNITMGVLGLFSALGGSIVAVVILLKFKDLKNSLPIRQLRELIGHIKKIDENAKEVSEHGVLMLQRAKDDLIVESKKLHDESNILLKIGAGMKKEELPDIVMSKEPEPVKETPKETSKLTIPDKPKDMMKKVGSIVKDQFFESEKETEEIDYNKMTRDQLIEIANECKKKIESDEDTPEVRELYDKVTKVIQRK